MRCLVVLVALGACSFRTAGVPLDGAGGDDDASDARDRDAPIDASPCRAVEVSAMSAHTCARMENGDVWCWGINGSDQIGRPVETTCSGVSCNPTPGKVNLPPITKLGVAEEHACAIAGPSVYCWGRNTENQFGDGLGANSATPLLIAQRAGASSIGGGLYYGCSLQGGAVRCSGNNGNGEVGDPLKAAHGTPFTAVSSGTAALANGYAHVCTVQSGFVYCWGANGNGQVETHPGGNVYAPTIVAGVGVAATVANGYGHTCAALASGDVRCWGANGIGQLGTGDTQAKVGDVVSAQVSGIVEIVAGADHTCARAAAGSVYCWGQRYASTPVLVPLARPAVSIAAGSYHDCFALDDGSVQCAGVNTFGQLGTGTTSGSVSSTLSQAMLCQ